MSLSYEALLDLARRLRHELALFDSVHNPLVEEFDTEFSAEAMENDGVEP